MKKIALLILTILLLLTISSCKWDKPYDVPDHTETSEAYNEDGSTYTITYEYVDSSNNRGVDPHFYKDAVIAGIVLIIMGAYFMYRAMDINKLRKRCTYEVPALVLKIRHSRHDGHIRFRYWHYNADYGYEYNGSSYESHNKYYGRGIALFSCGIDVGDRTAVKIDPFDPCAVYDILADRCRQSFIFESVFLLVAGLGFFVAYFIV